MDTTTIQLDATKRRDVVKFLMGLGTNPSLTARDYRVLRPFVKHGMTVAEAHTILNLIQRRGGI